MNLEKNELLINEHRKKFDETEFNLKMMLREHYMQKILCERDKTIEINFNEIEYNNKKYLTCLIQNFPLIIDYEDKNILLYRKWVLKQKYIIMRKNIKGTEFMIFLHNLIMKRNLYYGKGQKESIDHINRITYDNRKENLRLLSQTNQNFNQNKKKRKINLPNNCGFNLEDLPRSVFYCKAYGLMGDYLEVELINFLGKKRMRWSSSRSRNLSLKFKFEQTKKYLRFLKEKYPDDINKRNIETNFDDKTIKLIESHNEILKLSNYNNFVFTINKKNYLKENLNGLTENELEIYNNLSFDEIGFKGKHLLTKLPKDCGISTNMIPKYCYFEKKLDKEYFVINNHPKNINWSTSKDIEIKLTEKLHELMEKLKEIDAK